MFPEFISLIYYTPFWKKLQANKNRKGAGLLIRPAPERSLALDHTLLLDVFPPQPGEQPAVLKDGQQLIHPLPQH